MKRASMCNINKYYLFNLFISSILWLVILFLGVPVFAQEENVNAGLIINGIWFSLDPFFVNDYVRIYSAIQNQAGFDIIGKIQFLVDDQLLVESNFSVINGRLIEKWADWRAVEGNHKFTVKLIDTKKTEPGKEPVPIKLKFASITKGEERFVDFDTDGDRIGDRDDPDDDNDGLSDEEERKLGTDPLNPNDPPRLDEPLDPGFGRQSDIFSKDKKQETRNRKQERKEAIPVIEKTQKIVKEITEKLEEKKQEIEKEIKEEKSPKPILEKIPLLKIPKEKIPTWKQIYNWLITTVIYILNTWWLLLIVILIIFWIFWKIIKIFR